MKKRLLIFLFALLVVGGGLHNCKKDDFKNSQLESIDSSFENNFVPKEWGKKSTNAPEVLQMMVDSLRKINNSKSFATDFVEHFGNTN